MPKEIGPRIPVLNNPVDDGHEGLLAKFDPSYPLGNRDRQKIAGISFMGGWGSGRQKIEDKKRFSQEVRNTYVELRKKGWSNEDIAEYSKEELQIRVSPVGVGNFLNRMGVPKPSPEQKAERNRQRIIVKNEKRKQARQARG